MSAKSAESFFSANSLLGVRGGIGVRFPSLTAARFPVLDGGICGNEKDDVASLIRSMNELKVASYFWLAAAAVVIVVVVGRMVLLKS